MVLIKLSSPSRSNGHNFSTSFEDFTLIGDTEQKYEVALVSAAIWYSWYNISAELGNNVFSYKTGNTSPMKNITLKDGLYTITQLIALITDGITNEGDAVNNILIEPNYNTSGIDITVSNGYEVYFNNSQLYQILGFESTSFLPSLTSGSIKYESPHLADITHGVNNISINCSLVNSSYENGRRGQVLYSFTPNTAPNMLMNIQPTTLLYNEITETGTAKINNIQMSISDDQGRVINLNGEPVSYLIDIRKVQ